MLSGKMNKLAMMLLAIAIAIAKSEGLTLLLAELITRPQSEYQIGALKVKLY